MHDGIECSIRIVSDGENLMVEVTNKVTWMSYCSKRNNNAKLEK